MFALSKRLPTFLGKTNFLYDLRLTSRKFSLSKNANRELRCLSLPSQTLRTFASNSQRPSRPRRPVYNPMTSAGAKAAAEILERSKIESLAAKSNENINEQQSSLSGDSTQQHNEPTTPHSLHAQSASVDAPPPASVHTLIDTANIDYKGVLAGSEGAKALLTQSALFVSRELQWSLVLVGFQSANKYTIKNERGEIVGLIAEEDSLGKGIMRNIAHTHRSFNATIMDPTGTPILTIKRPFYAINSSMEIHDTQGSLVGEIHQRFHVFRRKYDLYNSNKEQFARVDAPVLSWDFVLTDAENRTMASVNKDFTGFAREIFTDSSTYVVRLGEGTENSLPLSGIDERAITLACAIAIDFDYFSRHSSHGGMLGMPIPIGGVPHPAPVEPGSTTEGAPNPDAGIGPGNEYKPPGWMQDAEINDTEENAPDVPDTPEEEGGGLFGAISDMFDDDD